MKNQLSVEPLTAEAFAPFGHVIEAKNANSFEINQGMCTRCHDLAKVETHGPNAHALINIFQAKPYPMPLQIGLVEKHPFGSQAFFPLDPETKWLVIVAEDTPTGPDKFRAFLPSKGQGVSYRRNTWHGVLCCLEHEANFLVVDRGGDGDNLVEHVLEQPLEIKSLS